MKTQPRRQRTKLFTSAAVLALLVGLASHGLRAVPVTTADTGAVFTPIPATSDPGGGIIIWARPANASGILPHP